MGADEALCVYGPRKPKVGRGGKEAQRGEPLAQGHTARKRESQDSDPGSQSGALPPTLQPDTFLDLFICNEPLVFIV